MQFIAVHSVPRSGSTWLGELFNSHPDVVYKYQPLFSYAFKGRLTENSSEKEIVEFFRSIALSQDDFLDQKEARKIRKLPCFTKSNTPKAIVYKEVRYHYVLENMLQKVSSVKVVGLIRNPFSVIHSWLNASREFRKDLGWNEMEEWRWAPKKNMNKPEEYNGYEKWKEVALLFMKLQENYPQQFRLLTYRSLLENTEKVMTELFNFCGLPMHQNTLTFIRESKSINNSDAYSVFKIKDFHDDEWKDKLNKKIIREIEKDIEGTPLKMFCI